MEIYDSYELEEELYDINRSYESFCSQISTFFSLERVFNIMKTVDSSLCMESFYNDDLLSLEDDNKGNTENDNKDDGDNKDSNKDSSDNKVGFMKKAWATIKSFFRRIFGFIKNLIRKVRIAVEKFKNKKWLKKSQRVFSGDTPNNYKDFTDKFGEKSDVLLTRGNSIYIIRNCLTGNTFKSMFESVVELCGFLTSYIDKTDDNVFDYVEDDSVSGKITDMINIIKYPTKIFKKKDIEEQRTLIKEFREKYEKEVKSFNFDSIKSSIHQQAVKEIASLSKGLYDVTSETVGLDKEKLFYKVVHVMKSENWTDTTKYVFEFLKKTDGYSNKIYKLLERAEKQGKDKMLKMIKDFMLLFNVLTSLSFSIVSVFTKYRKMLFKLTKSDRKGLINKVGRFGVGTVKNKSKQVGNVAKFAGNKAGSVAKNVTTKGVFGGIGGTLKAGGKILSGGASGLGKKIAKTVHGGGGSSHYGKNKFND